MKSYIAAIVLLMTTLPLSAQKSPALDSLLQRLKTTETDTGRVMLYYLISREYQFTDIDLSVYWATKGIEEARQLKYTRGIAYSLIQIGNIEQIRANYDESANATLEALELFEKSGDNTGKAIAFNNLGIIYHNRNDYSKALYYYNKSLEVNRLLHRQTGEAISLFCIGTVYDNMAKYDSALIFYYKGQKISELLNDNNLMAYSGVSLANVYYSMKEYGKAIQYNREALFLYQQAGNKLGQIKVSTSLGNLAEMNDSLDRALSYFKMALDAAISIQSTSDISLSLFSMAGIYEQQGLSDSAFLMYNQSYHSFKTSGNFENAAFSLVAMARILNAENKFDEAGENLLEAYGYANSLNSSKVMMEVSRELAYTFYGLGDYKSSFHYYRKYADLKDSVMTMEKQNQILDLQTQYETEKKEKENRILRQEQKILQVTRNFLTGGALMLVLIVFLILRNLKTKKKDNILLRKQKEEIGLQKAIVEDQKREITDSIKYARRIQTAILPSEKMVEDVTADCFILYLPRDIVSGDFYLLRNLDEDIYLVCAADCTGHGVPGAFLSMLGMSLLNDTINSNKKELINGKIGAAGILETLRTRVKGALGQTGKEGEAQDGMDMSICIVRKGKREITYAGANNSICIVADGELTELKSTRNPIGIYVSEKEFTDNTLIVDPQSAIYLYSDGYYDQINSDGSKFLSKKFKVLLREIGHLPMKQQGEILLERHLEFKGEEEQVDDILIIGVRIS